MGDDLAERLAEFDDAQLQAGLEVLAEVRAGAGLEGLAFPPHMADLLAAYADERARRAAEGREAARILARGQAVGSATLEVDE